MALTDKNKWIVSLIMAASAAVLFNPVAFYAVETVVSKVSGKSGMVASIGKDQMDTCATVGGYLLHCVVFFFVAVAIFQYDFACE